MSGSVHTLLGCQLRVLFSYFVHVHSTVDSAKSGRVQCGVRFIPISEFHSAEHLVKLVHGIFQIVLFPLFHLSFPCTRVVFGTNCDVNQFVLNKDMCGVDPFNMSDVNVSAQPTVFFLFAFISFTDIMYSSSICEWEVIEHSGFFIVSYRVFH